MSLKYDGRKPEPPYPVNVEIDENELAELRRDAEIVAWIEKHDVHITSWPLSDPPGWGVIVFPKSARSQAFYGSTFTEAITNAMKANGEK